ncbi:MAG: glycosyltransferase family 9 protein [Chloroflexi bacterium]|nr:glycosyltransferase family 9 protein [Chloroflexota bacterium]
MPFKAQARLLLLRALARALPKPGRPTTTHPANLLAIRPDHLGDLLLTAPALRQLRQALPHARITLLVGPWNQEAAEHLPYVDRVLTLPFPWFDRAPKPSPWAPYALLRREAHRLRSHGFDTALVLRPDHWWGAILAAGAAIPRRIGYGTPESLPFLTHALPPRLDLHETVLSLRLADAALPDPLPEDPAPTGPTFLIAPQERAFAQEWLSRHRVRGSVIALHPGAGAPVKAWRSEAFSALADHLATEQDATIVVTGSSEEETLVEAVAAGCSHARPLRLVGASLGQLAALLERCRLAIGVDSGVMHLAAAVNVPTVRLYGPVDPARFGPWGDAPAHHRVVRAALPCVPCNRLDYPLQELSLHPCVRAITLEQVLAAARSLLPAGAGVG